MHPTQLQEKLLTEPDEFVHTYWLRGVLAVHMLKYVVWRKHGPAADFNMADVNEVRRKQTVVIEFLLAEGETPLNIHRRLEKIYKTNVVDYSTVKRWSSRLSGSEQTGQASVADLPRSGRPSTAINATNMAEADALIQSTGELPSTS